jgi:hypothetical protein
LESRGACWGGGWLMNTPHAHLECGGGGKGIVAVGVDEHPSCLFGEQRGVVGCVQDS